MQVRADEMKAGQYVWVNGDRKLVSTASTSGDRTRIGFTDGSLVIARSDATYALV